MIDNLPPGLFYISADCGESFGHYLGRFRRANELSRAGLAELLAVPAAMVQAWETPSRQTVPTHCQLSRLSEWVSLSPARLGQMLPSDPAAIRLNHSSMSGVLPRSADSSSDLAIGKRWPLRSPPSAPIAELSSLSNDLSLTCVMGAGHV